MKNLNTFSKYVLAAVLSSQALFAQAQTNPAGARVDLRYGLKNREMIYTKYSTAARRLNNPADLDTLKAWTALVKSQDPQYLPGAHKVLQPVIKNQTVIEFISQAYFSQDTASLKAIIGLYYTEMITLIWEIANSPYLASTDAVKKTAQDLLARTAGTVGRVEQCVDQNAKQGTGVFGLQTLVRNCLSGDTNVVALVDFLRQTLNNKRYKIANQALSHTGYIQGNKVELLTQNHYDAAFIQYLAPMTALVQKGINKQSGKAYRDMSVEDFKALMRDEKSALNDIFSKAEGFAAEDHKVWSLLKANGEKNIYGQMMAAINKAEQSVFIDMFFIGGSIGVSLVKQLIAKSQSNPKLHIYVLNDRKNPLGYDAEMRPVYNYLRAYSEKFPSSRILVMEPKIDLKRTSHPQVLDLLVSDESIRKTLGSSAIEFKTKMNFYPKAKSDHSKVVVVDAKLPNKAVAFVGSKNFTDSSGGVAYDEVAQIQGPAVTVIQDSYYYDLLEAIRDLKTQAPGYLAAMAQRAGPTGGPDVDTVARVLLKPVDMLGRSDADYLNKISTSEELKVPAAGNATLMLGENNVYGTIRSPLAQDIAAIMAARNQIVVSDQYLYDPNIIKALRQKVLEYGSQVKAYILLGAQDDPTSPEKKFARIPNIVFLEDLISTGKIQIKWKKPPTADIQALTQIKAQHGVSLSPEYHLKGLSIDGVTPDLKSQCGSLSNDTRVVQNPQAMQQLKSALQDRVPVLISGSANKDVMTMAGGFREYQAVIFDAEATIKHDCLFWSRFDNSDQSVSAVDASGGVNYQLINLPPEIVQRGMTPKHFSEVLKQMILGSYNSSLEYFKSGK